MTASSPNELDAACDECGSRFISDTSIYRAVCAECAHHIYGWPQCAHQVDEGRCRVCGWDGSRSKYVAGLIVRRAEGQ